MADWFLPRDLNPKFEGVNFEVWPPPYVEKDCQAVERHIRYKRYSIAYVHSHKSKLVPGFEPRIVEEKGDRGNGGLVLHPAEPVMLTT